MKAYLRFQLAAAMVLLWSGALAATVAPQNPQVLYDVRHDKLSVEAQDVPLKAIMSRIAFLSGIEVMFDPVVDHTVSINFKNETLEDGIRRISRGLNTIYKFADKKLGVESLLISVQLLPQGKTDTSTLVPLMSLEQEAVVRTMNQTGVAQSGTRLQQRWTTRLQNLPSDQRQRVLEAAKEQRKKLEERRAMHDENRTETEAERQQTLKEIEQENEALRESDPERFRLRQQRRQEVENALRQPPPKR